MNRFEDYLTITEAAARRGISPDRGCFSWCNAGRFPPQNEATSGLSTLKIFKLIDDNGEAARVRVKKRDRLRKWYISGSNAAWLECPPVWRLSLVLGSVMFRGQRRRL